MNTVSKKYLMLNPQLPRETRNARLCPGPVVKDPRAPLLVEDRPWEARIDNMYANVLRDPSDGLYKCWYNPFLTLGRPGKPRETGLCYADSTDGIVWRKPSLQRVEFEDSRDNNLVMAPCHGAGVRLNPNMTHPGDRFLAIYLPDMRSVRDNAAQEENREALRLRLRIAVSPNGLDWRDLDDLHMPVYPHTQGDTHNNLLYLEERKQWVAFTRTWDDDPHTGDGRPAHRLVARLHSPDLRTWSRPVDVLRELPEELGRRQTYAMPVCRLEDGFLGLVMMWNCDHADDTVDCEMAWSPDTLHWTRVCPGQSLIPRGVPGEFDSHCLYAACEPIREADGTLRLYYGGSDGPHGGQRRGALGLARLRPDGFAGYRPVQPNRRAVITTRPIEISGTRLRLSADARHGEVRVSIPGAHGFTATACCPVRENVTDHAVEWTDASLERLRGKRLSLRFEIERAALYSFSFD